MFLINQQKTRAIRSHSTTLKRFSKFLKTFSREVVILKIVKLGKLNILRYQNFHMNAYPRIYHTYTLRFAPRALRATSTALFARVCFRAPLDNNRRIKRTKVSVVYPSCMIATVTWERRTRLYRSAASRLRGLLLPPSPKLASFDDAAPTCATLVIQGAIVRDNCNNRRLMA